MKTINFISLKIQNFKSIKNLEFDFHNITNIRGKNGVGKTTIADAIWWALFGKDSQGSTNFNYRPQDANGKTIHKTDVIVDLVLDVDGTQIKLGRVNKENWAKKRGTNDYELKGNVTTLFVNESQMKTQNEFKVHLDEIINEEDFKLLTNPMHFMNNVDNKKRREYLLGIAGDINEIEKQLKTDPRFHDLVLEWNKDINATKSFDYLLRYLQDKSKTDNETLKQIPNKIQALEETLGEEINVEELNNLIAGYKLEIEKQDAIISKPTEEPAWVDEALKEISKARIDISDLKAIEDKKLSEATLSTREANKERSDALYKAQQEVDAIGREFSSLKLDISAKEVTLANMKTQYEAIQAEVYVPKEIVDTCPTCEQLLPNIDKETIEANDRTNFESNHDFRLSANIASGKALRAEVESLKEQLAIKELEQNQKNAEINKIIARPEAILNYVNNSLETINALETKINELTTKINDYRSSNTVDNSGVVEKRNSYNSMLQDANRKIGVAEQQGVTRKSIDELNAKFDLLQETKVYFEVMIDLAMDFERAKNEALEENLTSLFTGVVWRLFEEQLNGGFANVCYPLLNGVPYQDQSTGERIFTGVDIIRTFQTIQKVDAPIIIDNRESLTLSLPTTSQEVNMYVDESQETLQVTGY